MTTNQLRNLPTLFTAAIKEDQFMPGFLRYLQENMHVWDAFTEQAERIWQAGRTHYSARTIIEVIRHESIIAEKESQFKVNNNAAPDFARLYLMMYPSRKGFFETRNQFGSRRVK